MRRASALARLTILILLCLGALGALPRSAVALPYGGSAGADSFTMEKIPLPAFEVPFTQPSSLRLTAWDDSGIAADLLFSDFAPEGQPASASELRISIEAEGPPDFGIELLAFQLEYGGSA